jgi:hypothetical protein
MASYTGSTVGDSDKFTGDANVGNCVQGNYPGPDAVYAVAPTASGMLTASLNTSYASPFIHVRTVCPGATSNEIACGYSNSPGTTSVTFPVTSGQTYYVAADSWANMSGSFTLTLSLN